MIIIIFGMYLINLKKLVISNYIYFLSINKNNNINSISFILYHAREYLKYFELILLNFLFNLILFISLFSFNKIFYFTIFPFIHEIFTGMKCYFETIKIFTSAFVTEDCCTKEKKNVIMLQKSYFHLFYTMNYSYY